MVASIEGASVKGIDTALGSVARKAETLSNGGEMEESLVVPK